MPAAAQAFDDAGRNELADRDKQTYVYFIVRQDGKYTIKHRAGHDVHTIVDWTENPAVVQKDDAGKATNKLSINVGKENVAFLVNDKEVHTLARTQFPTDGIVGIRVNHNLDVHVADFKVNGKPRGVAAGSSPKKKT